MNDVWVKSELFLVTDMFKKGHFYENYFYIYLFRKIYFYDIYLIFLNINPKIHE